MTITELPNLYTSQEEILRIYGEHGSQGITQDLQSNDLMDWWNELISDASDVINQYCLVFYEASDLATSRWVRTRTSWIAAHLLSMRRGNPGLFMGRYDQIMDELAWVMMGRMQIPGLPTRADMTPAMSNLRVDDTFYSQKIRVNPQISTGGNYGKQHLGSRWPWDWM